MQFNKANLNKKLFQYGEFDTSLGSFCKNIEETPMQLFSNCEYKIGIVSGSN